MATARSIDSTFVSDFESPIARDDIPTLEAKMVDPSERFRARASTWEFRMMVLAVKFPRRGLKAMSAESEPFHAAATKQPLLSLATLTTFSMCTGSAASEPSEGLMARTASEWAIRRTSESEKNERLHYEMG